MDPVNLFDYTDFRAYMRAWFESRNGRPSIRGFAKRAACSPAAISSVLGGTRDLPPALVEHFCTVAQLDHEQQAYFLELVEFEQAPTRPRRRAALDRIMAVRRFQGAQRDIDAAFLLCSRWYVPAILELSRCVGFREDPAWIAATIRPPITPAEAAEAVEALIAQRALRRDEAGVLRPAAMVWATDREVDRIAGVGVATFHRDILARASEALDSATKEERHFSTVCIAVPTADIAEIKASIGRFIEGVAGRYADDIARGEQVLQLSVQLIPMSDRMPSPNEDQSSVISSSGLPAGNVPAST
ncbi:MAG: TIGR02147 family protein [Myxococcota bacterium]